MSPESTVSTSQIPIRALHLDLKGLPPTPERLLSLCPLIATAGYNAVVVEWEDTFPWTVDPHFRSESAYTPDEVRAFVGAAASAGLEVIPLVQCLGHMETPLSLPHYADLREVPHKADVLNPLAPGARELVRAMVDDVLGLLPEARYIHLGGDEAWSFGTHPDTTAYIPEHGRGALYLQHVEPLLDALEARAVRPILWHDMMLTWDTDALNRLVPKADLCVWGYQQRPDETNHHHAVRHWEHLHAHGFTLWGGTAYKGADGQISDVPNWHTRMENAQGYADLAQTQPMAGVIATAWSRYSTHRPMCEPIDGALDCLVHVGFILRDGHSPADGRDECLRVLEAAGELATFEAAHAALSALAAARDRAWYALRQTRELLAGATLDARRRGDAAALAHLKQLRDAVQAGHAAAGQVRDALDGLVPAREVEFYLHERLAGLDEEYGLLKPRVAALEPDAARAMGLA